MFLEMKVSSPQIKKIQEETFLAQKIEKSHSEKVLLYLPKWNFLVSSL